MVFDPFLTQNPNQIDLFNNLRYEYDAEYAVCMLHQLLIEI